MSLKREFVLMATQEHANISALCRQFEISRTTGYKWIRRYQTDGLDGLQERSRRPHSSPNKTPEPVAELVCQVRSRHPAWGGRKIRAYLRDQAQQDALEINADQVPAASTCQAVLTRNGLIDPDQAAAHTAFRRFEKDAPNQLWQMDFKGHFALVNGQRCHPLTLIDDHSRFALALQACPNEQRQTVQERLTTVFRRYGLPRRILCDNGLPWGVPTAQRCGRPLYTRLNAWLFRLGIDVSHGRPYHPQTQGKNERFHRSLKAEVLQQGAACQDLADCQERFDPWRAIYNCERPHEALDLEVPARRYRPSGRRFPETLAPITYGPNDQVRTVSQRGTISFQGKRRYVGEAFAGEPVALRPDPQGGAARWAVYYCHKQLRVFDSDDHER